MCVERERKKGQRREGGGRGHKESNVRSLRLARVIYYDYRFLAHKRVLGFM